MADTSKLGRAFAPASTAPPTVASRLLAALNGKRPWKPIAFDLRGAHVTAVLTMIGTERELDIEGEVAKSMERRGLKYNSDNETAWEVERAARVLAEAVHDDDPTKLETAPAKLGSLTEWGLVPKEIVIDLYRSYVDFCVEHDPAREPMTEEDVELVRIAIQKKSEVLLRSLGVRRLAHFLATSDVQPASSSTPKSLPGPSSPAD